MLREEGKRTFYSRVSLNDEEVSVGECVTVQPDDPSIPFYIARIAYMWEDNKGDKKFHAHWFW